jgi:tRNA threonylcarbamoyladenosine modification (KEOPS) complex  Pcc1 subunit
VGSTEVANYLELALELGDEAVARATYRALVAEAVPRIRGVRTYVDLQGTVLKLRVEAPDLRALRAASNSLIKLTYLALRVLKLPVGGVGGSSQGRGA